MESASARRQSFEAAGLNKLPVGLSASGAVGETRGATVGDQSLRKAGWESLVSFKAGKTVRFEELAHQRREGNLVAEARFFYDPAQLK